MRKLPSLLNIRGSRLKFDTANSYRSSFLGAPQEAQNEAFGVRKGLMQVLQEGPYWLATWWNIAAGFVSWNPVSLSYSP